MKFQIGQTVWVARYGNWREQLIICPDCLGQKFLTVIVGNGSQITIDCECCKSGYAPQGKIKTYGFSVGAEEIVIQSIDTRNGSTQYNNNDELDVFETKSEAEQRCEQLMANYESDELNRLNFCKENPKKSWAWNATYHRRELKDALRKIEYHTSKLNVAKLKSKERVIEDVKNEVAA